MLKSLGYNLANLLNFSGRETRLRFWPYVGAVILAGMAAGTATMVPIMTDSIYKMQRFAREHPESVTETVGPGHYSIQIHGNHPELAPDISPFFWTIAAVSAVSVLLLAAAVARRLHDSNKSGLWGLLPLPFLAAGMVMSAQVFDHVGGGGDPNELLFLGLALNNLVYLAMLAFLVVLLTARGTPGENRYGSQPID